MTDSEIKSNRKYSSEDITAPDYVDPNEKNKIKCWIYQLLNISLNENDDSDLFDELRSGVLLCKLINKIKPNTVTKFKESSIAFFQRENIQKFIEASITIGIDRIDTFDTNDLFENKRLSAVIKHLFALNERAKHIQFKGPFIEDIEKQKEEWNKVHSSIISFKNTPIVHIQDYSLHFDEIKFDSVDVKNNSLSDLRDVHNDIIIEYGSDDTEKDKVIKHVDDVIKDINNKKRQNIEDIEQNMNDLETNIAEVQSIKMNRIPNINHIDDIDSKECAKQTQIVKDKNTIITHIEKQQKSEELYETETQKDSRNALLIACGVAAVGIALFVAMKSKIFFR